MNDKTGESQMHIIRRSCLGVANTVVLGVKTRRNQNDFGSLLQIGFVGHSARIQDKVATYILCVWGCRRVYRGAVDSDSEKKRHRKGMMQMVLRWIVENLLRIVVEVSASTLVTTNEQIDEQ